MLLDSYENKAEFINSQRRMSVLSSALQSLCHFGEILEDNDVAGHSEVLI